MEVSAGRSRRPLAGSRRSAGEAEGVDTPSQLEVGAHAPDGLVRITLKKIYTDRAITVDMDPRSLLCRLA